MKIINLVLALLFGLFAYFQYNDPDPWIWLTLYAALALAFALAAMGKIYRPLLIGCGIVSLTMLVISLPGLIDFAFNQDGISITEGMSNEKPYIEQSREFGGALIGSMALLFLVWQDRKQSKGV